eukprot:gnl/TRDRNA2_/TRDRNA2_175600_c2_seq15.p1 gnl/TRDRNA2_/TRDRNA2_175600_c2~~gnl/TRDRNA2_/TRDRNA2_175600_c2_seq15.p1  ORF type:complete len:223 (-),score=46.97 gnl/TRDRNA2_/TRDRNA2_175600_c2_seq15:263-931(-)
MPRRPGNSVVVHSSVKKSHQKTAEKAYGRNLLNEARKADYDMEQLQLAALDVIEKYDANGSGMLEANEVRKLLSDLNGGQLVSDDELCYIMVMGDTNASKGIGASELQHAVSVWMRYLQTHPEITPYLEKYDTNGNGRLEREELKIMLTELNDGVQVTDQEVEWVLEEADILGNSVITKPEMQRAVALWYVHMEKKEEAAAQKRKSLSSRMIRLLHSAILRA